MDLVSLSLHLSMPMCEDLHRDLWDQEFQAHEHKESLGQGRGSPVITGRSHCGLKANETIQKLLNEGNVAGKGCELGWTLKRDTEIYHTHSTE